MALDFSQFKKTYVPTVGDLNFSAFKQKTEKQLGLDFKFEDETSIYNQIGKTIEPRTLPLPAWKEIPVKEFRPALRDLPSPVWKEIPVEEFKMVVGTMPPKPLQEIQESKLKDFIDDLHLAGRQMWERSKTYFTDTLAKTIFKDVKPGKMRKSFLYGTSPAPRLLFPQLGQMGVVPAESIYITEKQAEEINEFNREMRDKFQISYERSQRQYRDWLLAHPEYYPRPEYEGPVIENISKNPEILLDYGYWLHIAAQPIAFSGAVLTVGAVTLAVTKNPWLTYLAVVGVMTPLESQSLTEDLKAAGVEDEEAATLGLIIGPIIAGIEVVGELYVLTGLSGTFRKALFGGIKREVVKEVAKLSTLGILKRGVKTFAVIEIIETLEELVQGAIQSVTVQTVADEKPLLEAIVHYIKEETPEIIVQTLIGTTPLALLGMGGEITTGAKTGTKAEVRLDMETRAKMNVISPTLQKNAIGSFMNDMRMKFSEAGPNTNAQLEAWVRGIDVSKAKTLVEAIDIVRNEIPTNLKNNPELLGIIRDAYEMASTQILKVKIPPVEEVIEAEEVAVRVTPVEKVPKEEVPVRISLKEAERALWEKFYTPEETAKMSAAEIMERYSRLIKPAVEVAEIVAKEVKRKAIVELTPAEIETIATAVPVDLAADIPTIQTAIVDELIKQKIIPRDAGIIAEDLAANVREVIRETIGDEFAKRAAAESTIRNYLKGEEAIKQLEQKLGPIEARFVRMTEEEARRVRERLEFPKPEEERRKRVAPPPPKTPIAALKERMRMIARGAREGRITTKRQIKAVQTELIDRLKKSDLSLKDKAKFIAAIKNIQTPEQLAKRLPEIEERIKRLEVAETKRTLLNKIFKTLKRTAPKKVAGKPVGKFTPEIQKNLDLFRAAVKLTSEQTELMIQDNLARYKDVIPPYEVALENKILSLAGGIRDKTNVELRNVLSIVTELVDEGRLASVLKKFNKDTEIQQWRDRTIDIVKGVVRKEVVPEVKPITKSLLVVELTDVIAGYSIEDYSKKPEDRKLINEMKKLMKAGLPIDPITVFVKDDKYIISDGVHRVIAAKELGIKTIKAEVEPEIKPEVKVAPVKSVPIEPTTSENIEKIDSNFRHFFATLGKDFVGMWDVMDMLSFNVKEKETFLHKFGETLDQENANKRGDRKYQEKLRTMFVESYDLKSDRDMLRKMRSDTVEESLGSFKNTQGDMIDFIFTKAEARKRWMELQDPTLRDTFVKGMYYTEEMIDVIDNSLSVEDKDFARKEFDFYQEYYGTINPTYSDIYGVNLPHNPKYSPLKRGDISRDLSRGFGEFGQEIVIRGFITKGSLKSRVKNIKEIENKSDVQVLQYHVAEMEHWKAWVKKVRDLNSVFGDSKVRQAIVDEYGKGILSVLDGFIKDFTRGGVETTQNMNWLDRFRGKFNRGVLVGKLSITIKQLGSWLAFADDVSVKDFAKGEWDFWRRPVSHIRTLLKSDLMQSRGKYMERDIKTAVQSDAYSSYRKKPSFLNSLMLNIQLGDKGAIVVGGWSVYKFHYDTAIKRGLSHEEAHKIGIRKFELATKKAQQSADLADLSRWQRGNSAYKLFTMFRSTPNQYFRKELGAVRNLAAQRITKKQFIKTIAIYHFILPMIFQFISDFGRWDKEEQLRAAWLGSLNGIFIIGDGLEWIVRKALGLRAYDMQVPIMSIWNDIGKIFAIDIDDITTEDLLTAVEGLFDATGKVAGVPTGYVYEVFKGIGKALSGEWIQALGMLAGWSEYIVGKEKKKMKVPSKPFPEIKMPEIRMPEIELPRIRMPEITL